MDYPTWIADVRSLLSAGRPDIDPSHVDPNEAYEAYKRGTSPAEFVRGRIPLYRTQAGAGSPRVAPPSADYLLAQYYQISWIAGVALVTLMGGLGIVLFGVVIYLTHRLDKELLELGVDPASWKIQHRGAAVLQFVAPTLIVGIALVILALVSTLK